MKHWKNFLLSSKLAISYSILILVFFVASAYTIFGLYSYKHELHAATDVYIPLVENTNRIERLTNQVIQYLWEYTALGDEEYYELGKTTLVEMKRSLQETENIISSSVELTSLQAGLLRITSWTKDLEKIIDESLDVQTRLKTNQQKLNIVRDDFAAEAKKFLYQGENKLRNELSKELIPSNYLYDRHRKNRLINLIVDKGNNNMITAFEAIATENPELLKSAFQQFDHINSLVDITDSLSTESFEHKGIKEFRKHFFNFRDEVYSLKINLIKSRELSVRRGEIATVVIFEARAMGRNGIDLAGTTLEENYQIFNRSVPVYFLGLSSALILAVIFSILITKSITIPIEKSVVFADEIASGNLDAIVDINQNDEVGVLAESLKCMGVRLKANMEELKGVERKMLSVSIEAEEKERKRMAEDLHDSLGPQLSIIKLYIDAMKDNTLPAMKKQYLIEASEEVINEAISQAKNIAYNLLPNLLFDFGLDMAIRSFVKKINEINLITINYKSTDYPTNLNRDVETMLFRVVKELINNTLKHAGAERIDIQLYFENGQLRIDYADNGCGFDLNQSAGAEKRGLINVYNRIHYISGRVDFNSSFGEGTQVKVEVDRKYLS